MCSILNRLYENCFRLATPYSRFFQLIQLFVAAAQNPSFSLCVGINNSAKISNILVKITRSLPSGPFF